MMIKSYLIQSLKNKLFENVNFKIDNLKNNIKFFFNKMNN